MEENKSSNEENVLIKVNNQISNEKNLSNSNEINSLLFQSLTILFSAALFTQALSIIPVSYKFRTFLPTLSFSLFGILVMILYVLKKQPTLKTYIFLFSFIIGAIIGV